MDAALQGIDVDAIPPPLVGTNCPDKLMQGHNGRLADITVRFNGGLPDIRCAAQRHHRARIKRNKQQAENASGTGELGKPDSGDSTSLNCH